MKLSELITKLLAKPEQESEVDFLIFEKDGNIVCADLQGPATSDIMRVMGKHYRKKKST